MINVSSAIDPFKLIQRPLTCAIAGGLMVAIDHPILNVALRCLIGAQITEGSLFSRSLSAISFAALDTLVTNELFGTPVWFGRSLSLLCVGLAISILWNRKHNSDFAIAPAVHFLVSAPAVLRAVSSITTGWLLGLTLKDFLRANSLQDLITCLKVHFTFIAIPLTLGLLTSRTLPPFVDHLIFGTPFIFSLALCMKSEIIDLNRSESKIDELKEKARTLQSQNTLLTDKNKSLLLWTKTYQSQNTQLQDETARLNSTVTTLQLQKTELTDANADLAQKNSVLRQRCQQLEAERDHLSAQTTMRTLPNVISSWCDDDRVLSKFRCGISLVPCVALTLDPDKNSFWDEEQILHWLKSNKTSPATRLPLDIADLKPMPMVNKLISLRLQYLKSTLENCKNKLHDRAAIRAAYEEVQEYCSENAYLFDDLLTTKNRDPRTIDALDLHEEVSDEPTPRPLLAHLDLATNQLN